ncbi:hypothetical protein [Pacificoceanicola onchidii]|uniref:hypothetical protein n=1 Tax=Pacificoceanicola onchidii TaxID=2562685 RepID=UPI0010A64CA4|nr:hypothetical protein [Pacificoceanicola onchidii]
MSIVSDALAFFDRFLGPDAHRKRQRVKLLNTLLDDKRKAPNGIRSLDTLALKTGMSHEDCRTLLSEMGCEGVEMDDGSEGWRKIKDPK